MYEVYNYKFKKWEIYKKWDIQEMTDILAMVTTCDKALAKKSVGTQTEAPCKNAGVQVSGCRECLSLALVPADSRDNGCIRCEQVSDLLSLVAELKEEVERLRCERRDTSGSVRGRSTGGAAPCPPWGWGSRRRLHRKQRTPYPLATEQKEGA